MSDTRHTLDMNGLFQLHLHYDAAQRKLTAHVPPEHTSWERFRQHIVRLLGIEAEGASCRKRRAQQDTVASFSNLPETFALRLGTETIGRYTVTADGALQLVGAPRLLTSTETRRIGTFYNTGPYRQLPDALLAQAQRSITTDFHTHSSGQISAAGLLRIARAHDAYYPTGLMNEAGIDTRPYHAQVQEIARVVFPPLDSRKPEAELQQPVAAIPLRALSAAELQTLAQKMALPTDQQSTFTELEYNAYRFRYPLTKNKDLLEDTWLTVAEEYAAQGVTYAEITFVGLENPELFTTLHAILPIIRQRYGVAFRYLVGIPRQWPTDKVRATLDKAKILSESPFMVGVDLIGYEMNKTREFAQVFHDFAQWANTHRPGFTLKVHAGENQKNVGNVRDYLEILREFPQLRGRIGHGLHGMDRKTLALAHAIVRSHPADARLVFEYNPASNVALNNLDDVRDIPFQQAILQGIPFVIGSDSSGLYGTDARQLGMDAAYAGLTDEHFHLLVQHQENLVARQEAYAARIAAQFPGWDKAEARTRHLARITAALAGVRPEERSDAPAPLSHRRVTELLRERGVTPLEAGNTPPEFHGKVPVAIVGASGSSWNRMNRAAKLEAALMADMLAHALNPKQVYFVHGREKGTGLAEQMVRAVKAAASYHTARGRPAFYNLGILADPRFDRANAYAHLSHMQQIRGGLIDIPDALNDYLFHQPDKHGVLIAAGGAAFTRDIISKADMRGMRERANDNHRMMVLLADARGASAEKARVLHPDYAAENAVEVIRKLHAQQAPLFAEGFRLQRLAAYEREARARVENYIRPDMAGQRVTGMRVLEGALLVTSVDEHGDACYALLRANAAEAARLTQESPAGDTDLAAYGTLLACGYGAAPNDTALQALLAEKP